MLEKLKRNLLVTLAAAAIIYLGLTIYADYKSVIHSFSIFNWVYLPVILVLSLLNYYTRFIKWDYYLKLLKIKIAYKDSLAIFMSGLVMSVTPGKMGEVLKSYFVKEIAGEPVSKTAPIILAERITDFISLIFLAIIGVFVYQQGIVLVILMAVLFILLLLIISNKELSLKLIKQLERIKFLKKHIEKVEDAYESSYTMLKPKPLVLMFFLSLISWFFECVGFYLILINFEINASLFWSTFAYAFATIAGSVTMLPAGLGVTEGSLTFLQLEQGIAKELAVASTFILRVVTLWFAVLLGGISVLLYQKRFGAIKYETN